MTRYPTRLLTRIVAPSVEPVTLAEAKLFLRVDAATEDALITDLIAAARVVAEEYLALSLLPQTWKLAYDDYAPLHIPLPRGPVQSVSALVSIDRTGASTTISAAAYYLNAAKDAVILDGLVQGQRVEITYVAGFATVSDVPRSIKQGILAHVAALYENRALAEIPQTSRALYHPHRVWGV